MERTKVAAESDEEQSVRWRKTGGGSFRMRSGRIIKQNQIFWAKPSEIPAAFRDVIVPLSTLPEEEPVNPVASEYNIQVRSPGWFDIVDGQGKVINENALREDAAKKMIEDLMK